MNKNSTQKSADPDELICAYQVIARACVQVSRSMNGTKFFYDTSNLANDTKNAQYKCRGLLINGVPFVIGARRESAQKEFAGYLFFMQTDWREWISNSTKTQNDEGVLFPLINPMSIPQLNQRTLAMPQNAMFRITSNGRIQICNSHELAKNYVSYSFKVFGERLDYRLRLDADAMDYESKTALYRNSVSFQVRDIVEKGIARTSKSLERRV